MKTERERISEIVSHFCESKAEFARVMGETPQVVSNWVSRGAGRVVLDKILKKFPEVNADWLLTGKGEMIKPTNEIMKEQINKSATNQKTPYLMLPLINLDAVGGYSNLEIDTSEYVTDVIPFINARSGDLCMPVSGTSMIPTYPPGTIVQIRKIDRWKEYIESHKVYVLVLNDGRRLVKEIRKSGNKESYVIHSHNPVVPDEEIPVSMIRTIFQVISMYQRLD